MSSGDSTSRAWCGERSIQRTWPLGAPAPEAHAPAPRSCVGALAPAWRSRASCRRPPRAPRRPRAGRARSASSAATEVVAARRARPSAASALPRTVAQRAGRGQAQLARRPLAARRPAPATAAGRAPAAGRRQQVAREVDHLRACRASVPRNCTPASASWCASSNTATSTLRQQLGHAAVAQRHVGEEQVVVDDDDVGRHRLAPRLHHVAVARTPGTRCRGSSRASR